MPMTSLVVKSWHGILISGITLRECLVDVNISRGLAVPGTRMNFLDLCSNLTLVYNYIQP